MSGNNQLKQMLARADSLVEQNPPSQARIHIVLLKCLITQTFTVPNKEPDTETEKHKLQKEKRLAHIGVIARLIMTEWPDARLITAMRNFFEEKKYVVELFMFALALADYELRTIEQILSNARQGILAWPEIEGKLY